MGWPRGHAKAQRDVPELGGNLLHFGVSSWADVVVDNQTLVVGFISGSTCHPEVDVMNDLQKFRASIVPCNDGQGSESIWVPEYDVQRAHEMNEWLRTILYLSLMQHLGYYQASGNVKNPDQPTNLRQVIEF